MLALTRHVAARWGKDGVRCNVVSPGVVLTEALLEAFDQTMLDRTHLDLPFVQPRGLVEP